MPNKFGEVAGWLSGTHGIELVPAELEMMVRTWVEKVRISIPEETADMTDSEVFEMLMNEVRRRQNPTS